MSEQIGSRRPRRPIRNFIIMPEVQWPYIIRLLAMVNMTGVLMATSICALFYFQNRGMDSGAEAAAGTANAGLQEALGDGRLMDLIIPAFVIGDLVSLGIGLWLSLYFSRKLCVPTYRIAKWSEAVLAGDLSARLKFRPGDDLQRLETACNQAADTYCNHIEDLRRRLREAKT